LRPRTVRPTISFVATIMIIVFPERRIAIVRKLETMEDAAPATAVYCILSSSRCRQMALWFGKPTFHELYPTTPIQSLLQAHTHRDKEILATFFITQNMTIPVAKMDLPEGDHRRHLVIMTRLPGKISFPT
jgi:hypothetical protein